MEYVQDIVALAFMALIAVLGYMAGVQKGLGWDDDDFGESP